MISARSRQQRLSGSRHLPMLALVAILVSSCSVLQRSPRSQKGVVVDEPEIKPDTKSKVDTIQLTQVSESESPPITDRKAAPNPTAVFKDSYRVVLAAPFDAQEFQFSSDRMSSRSNRILQFYLGFKYAFERLPSDVGIQLSVIDTRNGMSGSRIKNLPEYADADLLVGPYSSDELKQVADFSLANRKVLISPWNSTKVVSNNPYFVQMRPSLERHCEALTRFALTQNLPEEILVLTTGSSRDAEIRKHIQDVYREVQGDPNADPLLEFVVDDITQDSLTEHLEQVWMTDSIRSIVLPVWSDEPLLVSLLGKINYAKAGRDIKVLGLPQWRDMNRMDFDILENLNAHISSTRPVNLGKQGGDTFKEYFFDTYGLLPDDDAYYGMDLARWIHHMLKDHGDLITDGLMSSQPPDLNYSFEFVQRFGDDGETTDYFVNDFIQILKFRNYQFEPAR